MHFLQCNTSLKIRRMYVCICMYVCMFSSCLYFYSCQGEIIPKAVITHHVEASVFDWHPLERILAIGWADGTIHGFIVNLYTN